MINVALFGFGRIGQMHAENLTKNKEIKFFSERDHCINNSLVGGWKTVHNVKPEVKK